MKDILKHIKFHKMLSFNMFLFDSNNNYNYKFCKFSYGWMNYGFTRKEQLKQQIIFS